MKENKTVITGMGMINALGNTMEGSFKKMLEGVSGVKKRSPCLIPLN